MGIGVLAREKTLLDIKSILSEILPRKVVLDEVIKYICLPAGASFVHQPPSGELWELVYSAGAGDIELRITNGTAYIFNRLHSDGVFGTYLVGVATHTLATSSDQMSLEKVYYNNEFYLEYYNTHTGVACVFFETIRVK